MTLRLKAGLNGAKVFPRPTPRVFFHETFSGPACRPGESVVKKGDVLEKMWKIKLARLGEDEKAERFSTLRSRRKLQALTTSIAE
jgi:hypothetical protein